MSPCKCSEQPSDSLQSICVPFESTDGGVSGDQGHLFKKKQNGQDDNERQIYRQHFYRSDIHRQIYTGTNKYKNKATGGCNITLVE